VNVFWFIREPQKNQGKSRAGTFLKNPHSPGFMLCVFGSKNQFWDKRITSTEWEWVIWEGGWPAHPYG
jgi:hypothetical protein